MLGRLSFNFLINLNSYGLRYASLPKVAHICGSFLRIYLNFWSTEYLFFFSFRNSSLYKRITNIFYPPLGFDNSIVSKTPYQKHFRAILDTWLTFKEHTKVITAKMNKAFRLLQQLQNQDNH